MLTDAGTVLISVNGGGNLNAKEFAVLSQISGRYTNTFVNTTDEVVKIFGKGRVRYVDGEFLRNGIAHAEQNGWAVARAMGLTPTHVGASALVCPDVCQPFLKSKGIISMNPSRRVVPPSIKSTYIRP
jgi:hypothetical protein